MLNRFSIANNLERNKNRNNTEFLDSTAKLPIVTHNNPEKAREFLSEDVVKPLLNFGYSLDQIMITHKLYKFLTVDEAIHLLMRDPETRKFHHRYVGVSSLAEAFSDLKVPEGQCVLCMEQINEHIDFELDQLITRDIRLEVDTKTKKLANKEIEMVNQNQNKEDLTNNTVMKTEDITNGVATTSNNLLPTENRIDSNRDNTKILSLQQVQIPKETLEMFEDPEVCRICFAEVLGEDNKAQFACGHKFCKTCVTSHLNMNILNGKVLMIKCLYGGCPKTFVDEEIKEFVSPEMFYKYRKFKISQMRLTNPDKNYMNCPIPDCEEIIDISLAETGDYKMECSEGHQFCSKCMSPGWHEANQCQNYGDEILRQIKNNNEAINYKQCPQCFVIIEKNEGCNQMKCLACSFEFCWLCLKKYTTDHYAIYNFTGCPGMRFNTPKKKQWWQNPCLKALWLICSFFLGILAFFLLICFFGLFGCAYEFVKCYLNKKQNNEDDDENMDRESSQHHEVHIEQSQHAQNDPNAQEDLEKEKCRHKTIIGLLIFLGIICQPLYLIFYMLYGLMECYRRFSCWFYYVDY